jgi:hypothetical protein
MTDEERPIFAHWLALLSEAFNEPVSEARAAAYWLALKTEPLDVFVHGVREAIRSSRFFPKPVEILEFGGGRPVDAAWVNAQLSQGLSGKPICAFVLMFVTRLGGWRQVENRLPLDRLPLVERLYPGILAAFRARQLPVPTEASLMPVPESPRARIAQSADFPTPAELRALAQAEQADEPGEEG